MKTRKRQITFLLLLTCVFLLIPLIFTNCSFEPHTHYWGELGVKTAATCTAAAVDKRTCPCGAEDSKTTNPALGHNFLSTITTQPTCTEAGRVTCSRCSTTAPAPVLAPALGHNVLSITTQSTCTEVGSGTCSRCSTTAPAPVLAPALGHNVLSITTQPTCTEAGRGTCSRCSTTAPAPVLAPALGHNDLNWATYNSSNGQLSSCKRTGCSGGFASVGDTGPAGGKIIYAANNGFTVTGTGSFTAYYLEAAPTNQSTGISWSSTFVDITGATGTAIGTGKANTAAIIAAHPGDTVSNNAAKAVAAYTGGGKSDWFLPSRDELNAMYEARSHLGISSEWFWSSSQYSSNAAWVQNFASGYQVLTNSNTNVRAIRAF